MSSINASFLCPFCRYPSPGEQLSKSAPDIMACKGCGIVFTHHDRFYMLSGFNHLQKTGCRVCGSIGYVDITKPGARPTVQLAKCDGCGLVFDPRKWVRNVSEADLKRWAESKRR